MDKTLFTLLKSEKRGNILKKLAALRHVAVNANLFL